jgi:hypothetical protein
MDAEAATDAISVLRREVARIWPEAQIEKG